MASFLINGRSQDSLPVTDRAVHYGDGLFETIAVNRGRPLCWEEHMRRLQRGCERLHLPSPDTDRLRTEAGTLIEGEDRAVLKIILSRGSGGRGYQSPAHPDPTRILAVHPWPDYPASLYRDGLECTLAGVRLGHVPLLAGIKHLNRLEQVLARDEVAARGYREGLMLDLDGHLIEGTMSNLFLVRGRELLTPILDQCGVEGIIRGILIERAGAWDLAARIATVSPADLEQADEVFVCNSILGVCPVSRCDGRSWPVGPVTLKLRQTLIEENILCES